MSLGYPYREPEKVKQSEPTKTITHQKGEMVMWNTSNGTGTGVVIADADGDLVLVGVIPNKSISGANGLSKEEQKAQLREGPFTVILCVASTLWKQNAAMKTNLLGEG